MAGHGPAHRAARGEEAGSEDVDAGGSDGSPDTSGDRVAAAAAAAERMAERETADHTETEGWDQSAVAGHASADHRGPDDARPPLCPVGGPEWRPRADQRDGAVNVLPLAA